MGSPSVVRKTGWLRSGGPGRAERLAFQLIYQLGCPDARKKSVAAAAMPPPWIGRRGARVSRVAGPRIGIMPTGVGRGPAPMTAAIARKQSTNRIGGFGAEKVPAPWGPAAFMASSCHGRASRKKRLARRWESGSLRLWINVAREPNGALPNCRRTPRRPKDGGGSQASGNAHNPRRLLRCFHRPGPCLSAGFLWIHSLLGRGPSQAGRAQRDPPDGKKGAWFASPEAIPGNRASGTGRRVGEKRMVSQKRAIPTDAKSTGDRGSPVQGGEAWLPFAVGRKGPGTSGVSGSGQGKGQTPGPPRTWLFG